MAAVYDRAWLEARAERTKELIVAYEDAIAAIAAGAQSYTFDTGQTRQTVTKANVTEARNMLAALEDRLTRYEHRLCKGGRIHVTPGF